MRQTLARVHALETVGPYTRLRLIAPAVAAALQPGRPLLAQSMHGYLRHTWWPCAIHGDGFSILTSPPQGRPLRPDDAIDVLGPIGRGFRIDDLSRNWLLIAAGSGASDPSLGPLLPLIDRALSTGRAVTLAYTPLAEDQAYPLMALPPAIEVIRAGETDLMDQLDDPIAWADQVFFSGSKDFAARLAERVQAARFPVPRGFLQALSPAQLSCGIGVCKACWDGARLACVEGPVFDLTLRLRKPSKTSAI